MLHNYLKIRTFVIIDFVLDDSYKIVQQLSSQFEKVKKTDEDTKNQMVFVVSYTLLYQTQLFFSENVIQDKKKFTKFKSFLHQGFKEAYQVDPEPYIEKISKYIKKTGRSGEIQYLGSKICDEVGDKDLNLMLDVSGIFSSFLSNEFYQRIYHIWLLSNKDLNKVYKAIKMSGLKARLDSIS